MAQRGESLIELLVALSIMATAVLVLLAGLGTAITMSAVHRKQAAAGTYVRAFAEALESSVAGYPSGYVPCATTTSYASLYTPPTGFTATVTEVRYWTGSWQTVCGTDEGVQRVMLQLVSADNRVTERLAVIVRKPCRNEDDFPGDWPCL